MLRGSEREREAVRFGCHVSIAALLAILRKFKYNSSPNMEIKLRKQKKREFSLFLFASENGL